ncbi:MAG: FMN-binding protein [Desulfobulbus propionicus]|nr:MAG: FMN-binding protein [Desulfobulbus propionicus]
MKDIITIIVRLTLSCVLAGTVMGTTFIFTDKAKKHNEHVNEERVMYALLGYSEEEPAPESMKLHEVYRYVVTEAGVQSIGYLVPTKEGHLFIRIDLDGKLLEQTKIEISEADVHETGPRDQAVAVAMGTGRTVRFAEHITFVTDKNERKGYLLSGKFPGFKTHIAVILALEPDFALRGFEVMEHEEDPGLGGEIEQDYFKNQFRGKPFEVLKGLGVVKEPLPQEYLDVLEGKVEDEAEQERVMEQYRPNDIYALTGATISSRCVSNGIKGIVKKFAYRVSVLDKLIEQEQIPVAF